MWSKRTRNICSFYVNGVNSRHRKLTLLVCPRNTLCRRLNTDLCAWPLFLFFFIFPYIDCTNEISCFYVVETCVFPQTIWTCVHSYPVRTKPSLPPSCDTLAGRPEAGGDWHKLPQRWFGRGADWRRHPNPSSPAAAWLPPAGRLCLQPAGGAQVHVMTDWSDSCRRRTNWELK